MNSHQIFKNSKFSKPLSSLPYLLIPCLLATWLYAPALFCGKTQIHGDSIFHGLSVIDFNRKMIYEGISPLWTDLLYGGHPYFAEGQGGFLNPLNFVVALLFDPIAGQNIYHWLSLMVGALGMYLLCRHFRCRREASTFGALAVVFSAYWIHSHHNVTISGALCWIPWAFLCFERWIDNPTGKSALWLALSVSLLIFSGYPQAFHGAIIYMAVSLIPTLFSGHIGSRTNNSLRQYLLTGLAAIAVCIGLSAVQWLPLLELTTLSTRRGGTVIMFPTPLIMYLRGFLFTFFGAEIKTLSFGSLGSVFVCFIASLSLVRKPNHRMIGHIIAVVFLIILGLEYATPIFGYLIKYPLVPGLKYFRIVHLYLGISIIGLGLLGSFAIDQIQRQTGIIENRMKGKLTFFAYGSVLFLVWMGLILRFKSDDVAMMTYATFIAAYIMLMVFTFINKPKWFGHAVLILLVIEIISLRISPFPFADPKLLEKPRFVEFIQSDARNQGYKLMDISNSSYVLLMPQWSPKLAPAIRNAFMRAIGSSNVLWNITSTDANLALPLSRRQLIRSKMEAEISGADSALPGTRLIDYLGVRYISTDVIPQTAGLEPLITEGIIIMENKRALPRAQAFTRYEIANSAKDALNLLKLSREVTLILEPPFSVKNHFLFIWQNIVPETIAGIGQIPPPGGPNNSGFIHRGFYSFLNEVDAKVLPASTVVNDPNAIDILSAKMTNDQYKFEVNAARPAWLFIADANYPGWQALVDGQSTPVYYAQVLGKAILVPSGKHQIIVEYKPRSFGIGFCLLILTLFVLLIMGIRRIYLAQPRFSKRAAPE